jgi:hypothetical protein
VVAPVSEPCGKAAQLDAVDLSDTLVEPERCDRPDGPMAIGTRSCPATRGLCCPPNGGTGGRRVGQSVRRSPPGVR